MPPYTGLCVISTPGARGGGGVGCGGGVGNLLLLDLFFFAVGGRRKVCISLIQVYSCKLFGM